MMDSVIHFIFTVSEPLLLYWMIDSILSSRLFGWRRWAAAAAAVICTAASIYLLPNTSINAILFFCISLILTQALYRGKIYIKAFFVLLAIYIFIISDIIIGNVTSYFEKTNIDVILQVSNEIFIFALLAKIINLILIAVCIRYFKRIKFEIPLVYWAVLDVIIVLFAVILQFFMSVNPILQADSGIFSVYIFWVSLGFLFMSGLVLFFFGQIGFFYEKEKENYILTMRNRAFEQQLSYQEAAAADMGRIRHDINKNLTNIAYLLRQNDITESISYIDAITSALVSTAVVVDSGNHIIDAILNYKIAVCRKRGIEPRMAVDVVPKLGVNPMDLSAIFANLMDNAIEANDSVEAGRRYVSAKVFCFRNYLAVVVKNPFACRLRVENGGIGTSKPDRLHHGYGLRSIKASAEKYGGVFRFYTSGDIFSAVVLLPLEG